MEILFTKGTTADTMKIKRADGSLVSTSFPHKGPVPHDAVHFVVEYELRIKWGFWGIVAAGRHPEEVGQIAKAAGHASATRARTPDPAFVPAIQAERIVECFEADLWQGGSDPHTFRQMIEAGCEQSFVPAFPIDVRAIARIRERLRTFRKYWAAVPVGGSCTFVWPDDHVAS